MKAAQLNNTNQPLVDKAEESKTVCSNCGTTSTPLWRRGVNDTSLCNACGKLFYIISVGILAMQ